MKEAMLRKARESAQLLTTFLESRADALEACVRAVAARMECGGRLLTAGNGGSGCDASHAAVEFQHPIIEKRRALPALALNADATLLTAVGNDTDFSRIFVEQLELHGRPEDVLLAMSTSGASSNINRAVRRARELGLLTIGFTGRDGGALAGLCEFSFVVPSWSIHRIQETHTLLLHLLWDQVHVALGEDDVL